MAVTFDLDLWLYSVRVLNGYCTSTTESKYFCSPWQVIWHRGASTFGYHAWAHNASPRFSVSIGLSSTYDSDVHLLNPLDIHSSLTLLLMRYKLDAHHIPRCYVVQTQPLVNWNWKFITTRKRTNANCPSIPGNELRFSSWTYGMKTNGWKPGSELNRVEDKAWRRKKHWKTKSPMVGCGDCR